MEGQILRAASQRPVILLTGARQTGKTSALRHLFPRHPFVSLDSPSEAEQAEHDGQTFLERHGSPLIIDEVQYAPQLFRQLKVAVEKQRSVAGQYLLTGSQRLELTASASESLAGRVAVFELEPLSLTEIRRTRSPLVLEDCILRGGYPELYRDPALDAVEFYRSYIVTYLERDLRSALNVSSLRDFERFLRACAVRSSQILNKADLARDVGISASTVNEWISVAQASGILVLLEPWFTNRSKSITKSPKLYFADTGVLLSLLNIRKLEDLLASPLVGGIWETFVFAELRRRQLATTGSWSLHFFRDRGDEVDFLIHRGGRFELLEARWTQSPAPRDTAPFGRVARHLGEENIIRSTVICRAPHPYPLGDRVRACGVADLGE